MSVLLRMRKGWRRCFLSVSTFDDVKELGIQAYARALVKSVEASRKLVCFNFPDIPYELDGHSCRNCSCKLKRHEYEILLQDSVDWLLLEQFANEFQTDNSRNQVRVKPEILFRLVQTNHRQEILRAAITICTY